MSNLALEFSVSVRTIQRDIDEISDMMPIYVKAGKYKGGVYVLDDYTMDRMYMTTKELLLLKKVLNEMEDRIPVENIVGHCESYKKGYGSNHSDPEHWMKNFGETMNDFRTAVSRLLKNSDVNRENTNETAKTVTKASFFDGDVVSIDSNAVYYNGKSIPTWVKAQNWYVKGNQSGEKVIVDKNEKGTNSICSPINAKYLTIVKKSSASNVKESRCPYRVKVTVPSLNIRKGAGTDTANLGHITDKGIYTIVEERTGIGASLWGKLKSGVGWISLDYVNRI